jgi:hypothetical protein
MLSVTVQNSVADTTALGVQITSPTSGASVVKTTKVYVTASDNVGVTKVDLMIDRKLSKALARVPERLRKAFALL